MREYLATLDVGICFLNRAEMTHEMYLIYSTHHIKISRKGWDKAKGSLAIHYLVFHLSFKSTYLICLSLWNFFCAHIYSASTLFNCGAITQLARINRTGGHSQFGLYSQSIIREPRSRITDYIYCSKTKCLKLYL